MAQKHQPRQINKLEFLKIENFGCSKDSSRKIKTQTTIGIRINDKGLVLRLSKERTLTTQETTH